MTTATQKRQFEGTVVSTVEHKTVHVLVQTTKMHPKYRKQYTTGRKYAVHDETNSTHVGDIVRFEECRPMSKTKRWRIIDIVTRTS